MRPNRERRSLAKVLNAAERRGGKGVAFLTALCGAINGSDKRAFPFCPSKRPEGNADKSRNPLGPGVIRRSRKQGTEATWASSCLHQSTEYNFKY